MQHHKKLIIGSIEICNLPDLNITDLNIRVDTGAKTSSLHVDNIDNFIKDGKPWVKFDIHPDIHNVEKLITCEAPLRDIRRIKSSNGTSEDRYVIQTMLELGDKRWPIEITLTNRADMNYLMLLGREGMGNKVLVDPSASFLIKLSSDNK